MRKLRLYTTRMNLIKQLAFGAAAIGIATYLFVRGQTMDLRILATMCLLSGAWMAGKAIWHLRTPTPVFDGDADGFSVKGKAKRPWSDFEGISVHKARTGLFTTTNNVRINVKKTLLVRHIQIGATEASGPAEEMVNDIERFAREMITGSPEPYTVPPLGAVLEPKARQLVRPDWPARKVSTQTEARPVQNQRSLRDRIFGRSKAL